MMLTIEELASIPIFSKLPVVELEHLAKRAADMQLAAGEYAVHEGEERALFAVIAGKIEVTKRIDGIERTIGWRTPGKIFGEVPLALGGRSSAAIARRNPRASFEWMRSSITRSPHPRRSCRKRSAHSRASESAVFRVSPPRRPRRK